MLLLLLVYRWVTRFDGVLICGRIVSGVIGWDRWYFCIICCWLWSFSFNWSRLCFISDEAEVDDVMMNVDEELLGWSHSWCTASSGVILFLGSHLILKNHFWMVVWWLFERWFMINDETYSKHLLTKSIKSVSLHLKAWDSVFDPGLRLRPFEFVMQRGTPRESKQNNQTL